MADSEVNKMKGEIYKKESNGRSKAFDGEFPKFFVHLSNNLQNHLKASRFTVALKAIDQLFLFKVENEIPLLVSVTAEAISKRRWIKVGQI